MPLKPCLKASKTSPLEDTSSSFVATSHPPIPEPPATQLPRSASYIDYSALPYSQVFVHFPPSPTLTSTHVVDPPRLYDRSPIVVTENSCAMPQRGCPGRTYATVDGVGRGVAHPSSSNLGLSFSNQPRFASFAQAPTSLPALIPDEHGSSSDDSDALTPYPEFADAPAAPRPSSSPSSSSSWSCHPLCSPANGQHAPMCQRASYGHAYGHGHGSRLVASSSDPLASQQQFLPHAPAHHRGSSGGSKLFSIGASSTSPRTRTPASAPRQSSSTFASAWDTSSCLEGF